MYILITDGKGNIFIVNGILYTKRAISIKFSIVINILYSTVINKQYLLSVYVTIIIYSDLILIAALQVDLPRPPSNLRNGVWTGACVCTFIRTCKDERGG